MGLAVPRDVSVVGCDNISLSEFACPSLTTIDVPRDRIGHLVSGALMPDGETSPLWGREIVIEPELIIRDSTGPPHRARAARRENDHAGGPGRRAVLLVILGTLVALPASAADYHVDCRAGGDARDGRSPGTRLAQPGEGQRHDLLARRLDPAATWDAVHGHPLAEGLRRAGKTDPPRRVRHGPASDRRRRRGRGGGQALRPAALAHRDDRGHGRQPVRHPHLRQPGDAPALPRPQRRRPRRRRRGEGEDVRPARRGRGRRRPDVRGRRHRRGDGLRHDPVGGHRRPRRRLGRQGPAGAARDDPQLDRARRLRRRDRPLPGRGRADREERGLAHRAPAGADHRHPQRHLDLALPPLHRASGPRASSSTRRAWTAASTTSTGATTTTSSSTTSATTRWATALPSSPPAGETTTNSVVRDNVCVNNGRSPKLARRQGDLFISTWEGGKLDGVRIHNNTFYWNPPIDAPAVQMDHADFTGTRPNVFQSNLIHSTVPSMIHSNDGLRFDRNLYWYAGSSRAEVELRRPRARGLLGVPPRQRPGRGGPLRRSEADGHDAPAARLSRDRRRRADGQSVRRRASGPLASARRRPAAAARPAQLRRRSWALVSHLAEDDASRAQVVFLQSALEQFGERGLVVAVGFHGGVLEPAGARLEPGSHPDVRPWPAPESTESRPRSSSRPDGTVVRRWEGFAPPADLGLTLRALLGPPAGSPAVELPRDPRRQKGMTCLFIVRRCCCSSSSRLHPPPPATTSSAPRATTAGPAPRRSPGGRWRRSTRPASSRATGSSWKGAAPSSARWSSGATTGAPPPGTSSSRPTVSAGRSSTAGTAARSPSTGAITSSCSA